MKARCKWSPSEVLLTAGALGVRAHLAVTSILHVYLRLTYLVQVPH